VFAFVYIRVRDVSEMACLSLHVCVHVCMYVFSARVLLVVYVPACAHGLCCSSVCALVHQVQSMSMRARARAFVRIAACYTLDMHDTYMHTYIYTHMSTYTGTAACAEILTRHATGTEASTLPEICPT
jgi:hypothetical protein